MPYFDGCYFDGVYFHASACVPPPANTGGHPPRGRRRPEFIETPELPVEDDLGLILLLTGGR